MSSAFLFGSGIVGAVCGGAGYWFNIQAENTSQEAKEMRKTSTSPLRDIFDELKRSGTSRIFAEVYGKTWAPVQDQVRAQDGSFVVAKKTSTFESVEECHWIERMAKKSVRSRPNGPLRNEMVGTGVGDWKCTKKEKLCSTSSEGGKMYIFDQRAFVADNRERLRRLDASYAAMGDTVVKLQSQLSEAEREMEFAKSQDQQERAISRSHSVRESLRSAESQYISVSDALAVLNQQIQGTVNVPLPYLAKVVEGGVGGGDEFFELASETYRPNETVNVNVNVNTNSGRPAETFRARCLGWYEREYVVPMNRDVYALGEFSLRPLQTTAALVGDSYEEIILTKPRDPGHHYVCELGTETEIYDRKMSSAQNYKLASKVFYGLGGAFVLGGAFAHFSSQGEK